MFQVSNVWGKNLITLHFFGKGINLLRFGGVSERPKEHAWKVCVRQKRTVGSNPTSSVGGGASSSGACVGIRRVEQPKACVTQGGPKIL
jgi:hypothetical protein